LVWTILKPQSYLLLLISLNFKEMKNELFKILDAIQTGIIVIDPKSHRVIMANPYACALIGISKQKIQGRYCHEFIHFSDVGKYTIADLGEQMKSLESVVFGKGGKEIPVLKTTLPITIDNKEYLLESFIDITNIKQIQTQLKTALLKSQESDKLKTAFLENMSHELRTPLNAIMGFSNLLVTQHLPDNEKKEFYKIIDNSGNELLSIVDSILDVATLESKQVCCHISTFNLEETMLRLKSDYLDSVKSEVTIRVHSNSENQDLKIISDPENLLKILSKLISNAVKYTESGNVDIGYSIVSQSQEEMEIQFYVKDTGIGIPEEMQDFVFEKFNKIEQESKLYRGVGLGLTIAKRMVETLGGTLWVESVVDKGSVFYFTLPCQYISGKKLENRPRVKTSKEYDWDSKTILIAEDSESNYQLLRSILRKTNIKIIWAKNGKEACEAVINNKNKIDMILMDIQMPIMDGLEATRHIKNHKKEMPVIFQTAFATEKDRETGELYGGDDYIVKPIIPGTLLNVLTKFTN
jgi:PAS domain S-box-containing protein